MSHRSTARRAALSTVVAAALAAGTLGVASSASASAGTSVQRDTVRPATASSATASAATASRGTVRAAAAVADVAAVTCRAAEGFSRVQGGALYRLQDPDVAGGTNSLAELGQVGTGWTASAFAWTASGGDGVVYALTWAGVLKWYRYDPNTSAWMTGSGKTIGSGFVPRRTIANIALGGNGNFYVVRTNGQLVIYRHSGRLTGAATWGNAAGWVIGSGWSGNEIIAPNGDGTLYRQYNGTLYWYRHSDPASGPVNWATTRTVGRGWRFYDLLPAGGGVLYATQGGTGQVLMYRHGDPVGGADVWAASQGVTKYVARPDSFGITIDPLACSLAG